MCPNAGEPRRDRAAAQHGSAHRSVIAGLVLALGGCLPEHALSGYSAGSAESTTPSGPGGERGAGPSTRAPPRAPVPGAELWLDAGAPAGNVASLPDTLPDASGGEPCPPRCDAKPGALRGKSTQALRVAGVERSFIYYAPERLDPQLPAPMLIVAHGFSLTADELFASTGFDLLAEREGFLLAFPNGQGLVPWNIGADTCPSTVGDIPSAPGDDQAFIDAILAFVESDRALDREHLFVGGLAGGGYFASEAGCVRSDVRGIASHSGGSRSLATCAVDALPVIVFHGVLDNVVPVECGIETRQRWAEHNGCEDGVDARPVLGGTCEYSRGCAPGGQVVLCLFDELGRAWAGDRTSGEMSSAERFASATELTWQFFREFAW
jgi:polyhydroxybutyrate depolymerase